MIWIPWWNFHHNYTASCLLRRIIANTNPKLEKSDQENHQKSIIKCIEFIDSISKPQKIMFSFLATVSKFLFFKHCCCKFDFHQQYQCHLPCHLPCHSLLIVVPKCWHAWIENEMKRRQEVPVFLMFGLNFIGKSNFTVKMYNLNLIQPALWTTIQFNQNRLLCVAGHLVQARPKDAL